MFDVLSSPVVFAASLTNWISYSQQQQIFIPETQPSASKKVANAASNSIKFSFPDTNSQGPSIDATQGEEGKHQTAALKRQTNREIPMNSKVLELERLGLLEPLNEMKKAMAHSTRQLPKKQNQKRKKARVHRSHGSVSTPDNKSSNTNSLFSEGCKLPWLS